MGKNVDRNEISQVINQMSYPDFLIVYYLAQAMTKKNFGELLHAMAEDMPIVNQHTNPAGERRGSGSSNSREEDGGTRQNLI
jgi:hypothetical protein